MLTDVNINNVLFLDIETVPITYRYAELTEAQKKLWDAKWQNYKDIDAQIHYNKAGIYAEFSKVICISVAYFNEDVLKVQSFYGQVEEILLMDFKVFLENKFYKRDHLLCAHNGKEFDFPFLCRRMLINGLPLPKLLDIAGKKPWEIAHLDTMELWKFGDYKSYTSLDLLAAVFHVPTPKDDISGADVARVYYEENNIEKIKTYCCKDVITTARIMQKYKGLEFTREEKIELLN